MKPLVISATIVAVFVSCGVGLPITKGTTKETFPYPRDSLKLEFNAQFFPPYNELNPTNIHIEMYAKRLITSFFTALQEGIPMQKIAEAVPNWSVDRVLSWMKPAIGRNLPNYNTHFDAVDGIDSTRIRWLVEAENRASEDPVLLYFHGYGGYAIGMMPMFPSALDSIYQQVENDRLSILLLDYTTSIESNGQYPAQLIQAIKVYNKLTESCSNIYIGGDSAGGHLSIGLLRSIQYPMKDLPDVTAKPNGVVLISPWTRLYPEEEGWYLENFSKDLLTSNGIKEFTNLFVDNKANDYNSVELNPVLDTEADWSSILPSNIFVSVGELEVMRGDIYKWIKIANIDESSVFLDERFYHDSLVLYPVHSNVNTKVAEFFKRVLLV